MIFSMIYFITVVYIGETFDSKILYCQKIESKDEYCQDYLTQKEIEARNK